MNVKNTQPDQKPDHIESRINHIMRLAGQARSLYISTRPEDMDTPYKELIWDRLHDIELTVKLIKERLT